MSRARKHVLLGTQGDAEPPGQGQSIVKALGPRGSNLVEVLTSAQAWQPQTAAHLVVFRRARQLGLALRPSLLSPVAASRSQRSCRPTHIEFCNA
jgi:hypothetical protein